MAQIRHPRMPQSQITDYQTPFGKVGCIGGLNFFLFSSISIGITELPSSTSYCQLVSKWLPSQTSVDPCSGSMSMRLMLIQNPKGMLRRGLKCTSTCTGWRRRCEGQVLKAVLALRKRRRGEGPSMWDVIVVASGLAIMEGKIREGKGGSLAGCCQFRGQSCGGSAK
jgi:hypothetical protein